MSGAAKVAMFYCYLLCELVAMAGGVLVAADLLRACEQLVSPLLAQLMLLKQLLRLNVSISGEELLHPLAILAKCTFQCSKIISRRDLSHITN